MRFASASMLLSVLHVIKAQNSFSLQFIGTEISEDDQSKLDFCESKYCLLDADLLFTAATQNATVKPCDDFKKFALGTVDEHKVISDRENVTGLEKYITDSYNLRLKKVLSSKVNEKDTRVTKAMKKLYKRCVNSDYIRKLAVEEMREYLGAYGLKFYPEKNDGGFNLPKFVEEQSHFALSLLLNVQLGKYYEELGSLKENLELFLSENNQPVPFVSSFEEFLYEMFQIHQNGSHIKTFKKDFKEIAGNLKRFEDNTLVKGEQNWPFPLMSIGELNNLTLGLNLDWSRIINNRLNRKLRVDETIQVQSSVDMRRAVERLTAADKKAVADMLAYRFLFEHAQLVAVYQDDKHHNEASGVKRSKERWFQCMQMFYNNMHPALEFLYSLSYNDEKQREGIEDLIDDLKSYLVRKIKEKYPEPLDMKSRLGLDQYINYMNSRKLIWGYPKKFIEPQGIEDIYADLMLSDEQKFVNMTLNIEANFRKLKFFDSELKIFMDTFFEKDKVDRFKFKAFEHTSLVGENSILKDVIYIHPKFLQHPFYHYQRPRFFNTATVVKFFLDELKVESVLINSVKTAYEFYDDWLKAGNKDLQIGAHRMSDRQLFWLAVAQVQYRKERNRSLFHGFYDKLPEGISEAFHCKFSKPDPYWENLGIFRRYYNPTVYSACPCVCESVCCHCTSRAK